MTAATPQTRVRFAPSPTGEPHLGSALIAVANHAVAASAAGELVLRIDDTDRERSDERLVNSIIDMLTWLGVRVDVGPVFQHARNNRYTTWSDRLIESGGAYRCWCTRERLADLAALSRADGRPPRYDGHCRTLDERQTRELVDAGVEPSIRLAVGDNDYSFVDLVHGPVASAPGSFDDFIIRRPDGTHTYLFASAVDDHELQITHVVRGDDHLPNTPRQLAVWRALQVEPPHFAHLPLIREKGGAKLSKRHSPGISMSRMRTDGVPPAAVKRYLLELLGQGADVSTVTRFDLGRVPRSAPEFDAQRLVSLIQEELAAMSSSELIDALEGRWASGLKPQHGALLSDLAAESTSYSDLARRCAAIVAWHPPEAPQQSDTGVPDISPRGLAPEVIAALDAELDTPEQCAAVVGALRSLAKEHGEPVGKVLRAVRRAVSGAEHGPGLAAVLQAVGRDEVVNRARRAVPMASSSDQKTGLDGSPVQGATTGAANSMVED